MIRSRKPMRAQDIAKGRAVRWTGAGAVQIPRPDPGPIQTALSTSDGGNRRVREFESFSTGSDPERGLFGWAPSPHLQTESAAAGAAAVAKWRKRRGLRRVGRAGPRPAHALTKTAPPGAEPSKTPRSERFRTVGGARTWHDSARAALTKPVEPLWRCQKRGWSIGCRRLRDGPVGDAHLPTLRPCASRPPLSRARAALTASRVRTRRVVVNSARARESSGRLVGCRGLHPAITLQGEGMPGTTPDTFVRESQSAKARHLRCPGDRQSLRQSRGTCLPAHHTPQPEPSARGDDPA